VSTLSRPVATRRVDTSYPAIGYHRQRGPAWIPDRI